MLVSGAALAAVVSAGVPGLPVGNTVRVHSLGENGQAVTSHVEWSTRGSEFSQGIDLDYVGGKFTGLPVRPGRRMVIRLRRGAESVAVKIHPKGRRPVRRRARTLSPKGTVWRLRVPGGISSARYMQIGVRYRPFGRIRFLRAVVYEMTIWTTSVCPPVDAIA